MSLTKLSLGGNNDVIYKLFPPREILVSDIPAGVGNIEKLFYGVHYFTCMIAKTAETRYTVLMKEQLNQQKKHVMIDRQVQYLTSFTAIILTYKSETFFTCAGIFPLFFSWLCSSTVCILM
jgi:hypothetical protein